MATKVIQVCDWHDDEDVEAPYHNEWTNPKGEHRQNDLCQTHQMDWTEAWEVIDRSSTEVPASAAASRPARRKSGSSRTTGPSQQAIIKAWARSVGHEVKGSRVPFNIEMEWKEAGSPNLLEGQS
ncbi:hypothetical protein ACTMTF_15300 [Nonomuraea sp. ZG12]|uniref:hypothetical protein n=1 Tax=Nonomuraea sp. ZG12 TaxID=3452207 RepID=UPI003F8B291B